MHRLQPALLILALSVTLAGTAAAAPAQDNAADPALEQRVTAVAAELRCLVCQNQTLADSHAELALDLKRQVREQLQAGRTPEQVLAYMTERYGDFVLYRPPVKATTWLLWFGPALLLLAGMAALRRALKQRERLSAPQDIDAAELRRAQALLAGAHDAPGTKPQV